MTMTLTAPGTGHASGSAGPWAEPWHPPDPGTVTPPVLSRNPACLLCEETGTVYDLICPCRLGYKTRARFPVLFAVQVEFVPGEWTTAREGVLVVRTARQGVLDALVANLAAGQALARDGDEPIVAAAALLRPDQLSMTAHHYVDPGETVEDAMRRLDQSLRRILDA